MPIAGEFGWTVTGDSTANASLTVTKAAGAAGVVHYVSGFSVVLSGAAAAADASIELRDGATVKWKEFLGSGAARGTRVAVSFDPPIEMSAATAVNLVVGAAGAGAVTTGNIAGLTE